MRALNPNDDSDRKLLFKAARLWGVSPSYINQDGKLTRVAFDSLVKILAALTEEDILDRKSLDKIILKKYTQRAKKGIESVLVAWNGNLSLIKIVLPRSQIDHKFYLDILTEQKEKIQRQFNLNQKTFRKNLPSDGSHPLEEHIISLNMQFTYGYHRYRLEWGGRASEGLLISAPESNPRYVDRVWGFFAPLYALRSEKDWGIGSLRELGFALNFVKKNSGNFIGTLPLLACEDYTDPSPYAPSSRLFWNEIYLDVEKTIEDFASAKIHNKLLSSGFIKLKNKLHNSKLVNYKGVYKLKKQILIELSQLFFDKHEDSKPDYQEFLVQFPHASEYAQFRGKGDENEVRFHLFAQFQLAKALGRLAQNRTSQDSSGLYLDFPLGVSPGGFDCHRFKEHFLDGFRVGSPPDAFFPKGQNWGFLPLHPYRMREQSYDYFIKSIQNHLRFAQILRLDHIMGLHRLYIIPQGSENDEGVYLRYPCLELYAILNLEAWRRKCTLVGEDLGTVPASVRKAMGERGIHRMWVYQFELGGNSLEESLSTISRNSLVCFNTHDMPTFLAFWQGRDLKLHKKLNLADSEYLKKLLEERKKLITRWEHFLGIRGNSVANILFLYERILSFLVHSFAPMICLNFEDIWQEDKPQNVPGTTDQYPNWQQKHEFPIEKWANLDAMRKAIDLLNEGGISK